MSIRFCEFCSTVHPDESTHCPDCGARLTQEVSEEYFNDPANPWPFVPVDCLHLRIQGQPRTIRFSGTHSVYHLWTVLHREYDRMALCCRAKAGELELASFPQDQCPAGYERLDPGKILNSSHCRFSLYTYEESDPEVDEDDGELEMTYHGSFEIEACPHRFRRDVLGWLLATEPRPEAENNWTYDIS